MIRPFARCKKIFQDIYTLFRPDRLNTHAQETIQTFHGLDSLWVFPGLLDPMLRQTLSIAT